MRAAMIMVKEQTYILHSLRVCFRFILYELNIFNGIKRMWIFIFPLYLVLKWSSREQIIIFILGIFSDLLVHAKSPVKLIFSSRPL